MKFAATLLLIAGSLSAQPNAAAPKGDGCAPPPGATAPKLPAKLLEGQGTVHVPITTSSPEAQKFFDQGLAQMHSFWAREAERSFLQAAALDPEAPMPHVGIAMVAAGFWRPRFQIDTQEIVSGPIVQAKSGRALDAAKKAVELSRKPGKATDQEKMYVDAIWAWRNPNAKHPFDDYTKSLRALIAKYPKDVEARTHLALMTMRGFTLPDKKPRPGSMEAVEILRQLLIEAPNHPGVHHYVIHGWEGANFAKDAWPSSEKYAQLVSGIPHALHMPGHIWSQTGRWGDAVKAFDAAAARERAYMKDDSLYGSGHHGHNVHYLAASSSFSGDYENAVKHARELLAMKETPRDARSKDDFRTAWAQGWISMMRTLVQFRKWDELIAGEMLPDPPRAREQAWRRWAVAVAYAHKGNLDAARRESRHFETALARFRAEVKRKIPEELLVARAELAGHLLLAEGKIGKGLKRLESASSAERRLRYSEPPAYPRPAAEALGAAAAKHGRSQIAERAYRAALEQYPEDHHAQAGLQALRAKPARDLSGGL